MRRYEAEFSATLLPKLIDEGFKLGYTTRPHAVKNIFKKIR